jgi:phosphoribosylformimino-5-aminoimidazole carboxamide ribotide isomerase
MIAYAAIDLHRGNVVQLVGGETQQARVVLHDPVAVACSWVTAGFAALHVVDLDAALGTGSNADVIERIIGAVGVPVQVGGGIRSDDAIRHWVDAGAARVVIGTRALLDRAWLNAAAERDPQRLVVAADVRNGFIATHGWRSETAVHLLDYVRELNACPLAGVLITDINREGRLLGADASMFRSAVDASAHPVIASGGIATTSELRILEQAGVAGVVLGMALYTGAIDPVAISQEYTK